jgi:hypothetical protein
LIPLLWWFFICCVYFCQFSQSWAFSFFLSAFPNVLLFNGTLPNGFFWILDKLHRSTPKWTLQSIIFSLIFKICKQKLASDCQLRI